MDRESIVASDLSIYSSPLGTRTLATPHVVLAPPPPPPVVNPPHADWRRLPDAAVSLVLDRLPVVDLFRLGYLLSPRWLHIWRARPLYLHDHQFTTPPIPAANVANAITNVLHHHVGDGVQFVPVQGGGGGCGDQGEGAVGAGDEGVTSDDEEPDIYDDGIIRNGGYEIGRVFCFRVETTRWSLEHLGYWCAALQRGGARVLMLANLAIPEHSELPQAILHCGTSLLGLHVFFFTVEAYHIEALRQAPCPRAVRLRLWPRHDRASPPPRIRDSGAGIPRRHGANLRRRRRHAPPVSAHVRQPGGHGRRGRRRPIPESVHVQYEAIQDHHRWRDEVAKNHLP